MSTPRSTERSTAHHPTARPAVQHPAIELRDLVRTFRGPGGEPVHAVRGVDLTIPAGQVVALLGPNGAGKTTTLDIVLGLTPPTSGTARVLDRSPRQAIGEGRIAALLQTGGLLADLTVVETMRAIAALHRAPIPVEEGMRRAGIAELARRRVGACSGGQQQKLRFALALLPDPDLLVLDEPTAAMDVTTRREFWASMHAEAEAGKTIVFATHHLDEADAFADRIVLMARGRIVADGPTAEIRASATARRVSARWTPLVHDPVPEELPGVTSVERADGRITLTTTDSDATARTLLVETDATDVEISSGSLDEAFVALTADEASVDVPTAGDPTAAVHAPEEAAR